MFSNSKLTWLTTARFRWLYGKIKKSVSTDQMVLLQPHPMFQHKVRTFKWAFLQKPFQKNTQAGKQIRLLTYEFRHHSQLTICWELLDTAIGVAPAYSTSVRDIVVVHPSPCTFNNTYHLLCLPSLTSETREMALQYSTGWSGQTIKLTNLLSDLIPTANIAVL